MTNAKPMMLNDYITTQTSGDSTVDMYWAFVNYKHFNIMNDLYPEKDWFIDETLNDANWLIRTCDSALKYRDNALIRNYRSAALFIIKQLEELKCHLSTIA